MVKLVEKENKKYFVCEECGFVYDDEELAQKCQEWCARHQSCNLEITGKAVAQSLAAL